MFDLKQSNYEKGGYIKEKMYLTLQEKQLPCCDKYEHITIYCRCKFELQKNTTLSIILRPE